MGKRLSRWRELGWPARRQLLLLALILPSIDVILRVAGYSRMLSWIERITPKAGSKSPTEENIKSGEALARHAAMASGQIPWFNTSCLRQSLWVYWRLRRLGFAPVLQLGIRPIPGKLDAHAWIEMDGKALQNDPLRHQPFILPDQSH